MQRYYSLKKTIDANVRVITHTYMLFAYVITFDYSSHTYMLFVQDIITQMYTSAQVTFHINSLHINVTCSFNSVMSSLYTKLCTCTLFLCQTMKCVHFTFPRQHYRVSCVHVNICVNFLHVTLSRRLCTFLYQVRHISASNVYVFSFCFNCIHATF